MRADSSCARGHQLAAETCRRAELSAAAAENPRWVRKADIHAQGGKLEDVWKSAQKWLF